VNDLSLSPQLVSSGHGNPPENSLAHPGSRLAGLPPVVGELRVSEFDMTLHGSVAL